MTLWSEDAWKRIAPTLERTLEHPFVRSLADGTLPQATFLFYLQQDALYLRQYFRVLAHIASRLHDASQAAAFVGFAADGVAVEQTLHESYLKAIEHRIAEPSPTCRLYTSTLLSQAYEPVEVEAAAVLPCFWVYQHVGEHIVALSKRKGNPYARWIDTYADPAFAASTKRAIAICDALAEEASPAVRDQMTDIFTLCARLEWMFWDSAMNLEQWKI